MSAAPEKYEGVIVSTKANIYFDGKVVSHTIHLPDGSRKTLGLIYEGSYTFGTSQDEEMAISAGSCHWRMKGESEWKVCSAGQSFKVPAGQSFDIQVGLGICEYVCSYS